MKAYNNKEIKGIIVTKNIPNVTHQQYGDDTILPRESSQKETINLKLITEGYMKSSGKKVNDAKSKIFFINTEAKMENQICQIIGYKKGVFPCKYLGIELEKSIKSSKVWNNTLEKIGN